MHIDAEKLRLWRTIQILICGSSCQCRQKGPPFSKVEASSLARVTETSRLATGVANAGQLCHLMQEQQLRNQHQQASVGLSVNPLAQKYLLLLRHETKSNIICFFSIISRGCSGPATGMSHQARISCRQYRMVEA
ncbi:hypothetical protein KCU81_g639, partial [Aureobasidium melanogenum]